jgi:hypothetical protein
LGVALFGSVKQIHILLLYLSLLITGLNTIFPHYEKITIVVAACHLIPESYAQVHTHAHTHKS